ncbi:MAG TPA: hypothetical protein VGB74_10515 [Actinoplanes sp.]
MTTSSATTSTTRTAGLAAFAVAGLADIITAVLSLSGVMDEDAPPIGVPITLIVTGLVSAATLFAGRGTLIAAYVARVVSTGLFIPAFAMGAPVWVKVLGIIAIVLSVAGIWLTLPALRRHPAV